MFKKYTNLIKQKQHSYLGQSNSLPIICILPLQRSWSMHFGLAGSHNQLCTFHTLINSLVTNLFYIHAQRRIVEAARRDKNGVLQSVPWSLWHSLSDMTSASCGSPNQQSDATRSIEVCSWTFFCRPKTAMLQCWRTVFGLATNIWQSILKVFEALWRLRKVVLRTSLRPAVCCSFPRH